MIDHRNVARTLAVEEGVGVLNSSIDNRHVDVLPCAFWVTVPQDFRSNQAGADVHRGFVETAESPGRRPRSPTCAPRVAAVELDSHAVKGDAELSDNLRVTRIPSQSASVAGVSVIKAARVGLSRCAREYQLSFFRFGLFESVYAPFI